MVRKKTDDTKNDEPEVPSGEEAPTVDLEAIQKKLAQLENDLDVAKANTNKAEAKAKNLASELEAEKNKPITKLTDGSSAPLRGDEVKVLLNWGKMSVMDADGDMHAYVVGDKFMFSKALIATLPTGVNDRGGSMLKPKVSIVE